jgi:hypothetical protein
MHFRLSAGIRQNERIIGFYGLLVSVSGDCAEGCMAKQRRRRNVGAAPYEVIRPPFIEKEEHPQNQPITSLFVGYCFRRRRRNRPSNRTQQEPSSRSQEISDIERVWP